jgi:alpha-ribazole phosphatase
MKVYIIRHSITKGNLENRYVGSTDEHLCEKGIALAKSKNFPLVEKVYTSPLLRCLETADILFPEINKTIIPGLRETDFGDFEYKNYEELNGNPAYQRWIDSNGTSGFPNGEGLEEVNRRVQEVFRSIMKDAFRNQYTSIAVVTHGGTIMSIMSQFSSEKKDYFEWQVKNCEGYLLEMDGGSQCYR